MFKKTYIDSIEDMLQACKDIQIAVQEVNFREFEANMLRYRAVERLFEILGEAANRMPKDLQEKYTNIPWKNIIGMRNIIIHTYERVDTSTLWGAAKKDLKKLIAALNKMLLDFKKDENK